MSDVLADPRLAQMLRAGMSDPVSVALAEKNWPVLGATQPAGFLAEFDEVASIKALALEPEALSGLSREFFVIAGWHGARNRPELEGLFRRRAENVRQLLREKLN